MSSLKANRIVLKSNNKQYTLSNESDGLKLVSDSGKDILLVDDQEVLRSKNNLNVLDYSDAITTTKEVTDKIILNRRNIDFYKKYLYRGFNNKKPSGTFFKQTANEVLGRAKKQHLDSDLGIIDLFEPDGTGTYGAVWIRDMSMCMRDYIEYFSADQIKNSFLFYLKYSNPTLGTVPDHINIRGGVQVFSTPGTDNNWGSREPTDGNTFLLQLAWLHYVKTNDTFLYDTYKDELQLLLNGIPVNEHECVYVDPDNPFVTWGFIDTVKLTNVCLFGSLLKYVAHLQMADMSDASGDYLNSRLSINKAESIKDFLNKNLFDKEVDLYRSSTGLCRHQYDVWGSAYAVYVGVSEYFISSRISDKIGSYYNHYYQDDLNKPSLFFNGGVRHVIFENDFIPDQQVWEEYFSGGNTYNTYQSGAYWSTPIAWIISCLNITRSDVSASLLVDIKKEYERQKQLGTYGSNPTGSPLPAEFWTIEQFLGAPVYCTSSVSVLQIETDFKEKTRYVHLGLYTGDSLSEQSLVCTAYQWTVIPFSVPILTDFGSINVRKPSGVIGYPFLTLESGIYNINVAIRLNNLTYDPGQETTTREILIRVCINNDEKSGPILLDTHVSSNEIVQNNVSLNASGLVFLQKYDVIDIRVYTTVGDVSVQYDLGVENIHDYNYLKITES